MPPLNNRQFLRIAMPAAFVAAISFLSAVVAFGHWAVWKPDSFWYLDSARYLAETGTLLPERFLRPPGFCFLLAPLIAIDGDLPLFALKIFLAIGLATTTFTTYLLNRQILRPPLAWAASLCVAFSPALLRLSVSILTEIPFTFLACCTLLLCGRWKQRGLGKTSESLLAAALLTATIMTRAIGIVLVPIVLMTAWRCAVVPGQSRIRHIAMISFIAITPLLLWQHRQNRYPVEASYLSAITQDRAEVFPTDSATTMLAQRARHYGLIRLDSLKALALSPVYFWRFFQPPLAGPSSLLIGGACLLIAAYRYYRLRHPMDAYVLLTFAVLAIWPYDEGVRLIAPLAPVVLAYPLWFAELLQRRINSVVVQRLFFPAVLLAWLALQTPGTIDWFQKLPAQRKKSDRVLSQMTALADCYHANFRENDRLLAITPRGSDEKLRLLGAAYLARFQLHSVYARPDHLPHVTPDAFDWAIVQASLVPTVQHAWNLTPTHQFETLFFFRLRPTALTAYRDDYQAPRSNRHFEIEPDPLPSPSCP